MSHDVIVIGASAGSIEVLKRMAGDLPANFPASIFIALHTVPGRESLLPAVLTEAGPLPATHPLHEEPIERGHIYIAPPDNHLVLRPGSMQVVRGPKENGHRPSVDALFRSAAISYGTRVIAVVLSGYQDCGTAGMMSIKARGGLCVVQAPESARADEMPLSVISRTSVDHVVRPEGLGALLVQLVAMPAGPTLQPTRVIEQLEGTQLGAPAELVCPACSGVLTEVDSNGFQHFRCHVGHAFSLHALIAEQSDAMERALWAAVRSLEESAALSRRVSSRESGDLRERFEEKTRTHMQQADLIRTFLLHGAMLTSLDAPAND